MTFTSERRYTLVGIIAALAVVFSAAMVVPLGAHTEVFDRSPVAGEAVGGVVDRIDISFWSEVLSGNITVVDPSGADVETTATQVLSEGRVTPTTISELTEPGRYTVTHGELSPDGDLQTAEWFFIFDPESDNRAIPLVATGGGGPNWIVLIGVSGIILILAGVLWPRRSPKTAAA